MFIFPISMCEEKHLAHGIPVPYRVRLRTYYMMHYVYEDVDSLNKIPECVLLE